MLTENSPSEVHLIKQKHTYLVCMSYPVLSKALRLKDLNDLTFFPFQSTCGSEVETIHKN